MSTSKIVCKRCQKGDRLVMKAGKGPHYRELYCEGCECHVQWIAKGKCDAAIKQGIRDLNAGRTQLDLFGGGL